MNTYSKEQIKNIIKTLPIGYYVGRDITIDLDDISTSYYIPEEDTITISYQNILDALSSIKEIEDKDLEEITRGILYHEVSHAFLTPKDMSFTEAINIVEDERIETVLNSFYLNTNFKRLVKLVNGFKGEKPETAKEAFYQLVRYRIGEERWLKELEELIDKYSGLNRNSYDTYYYTSDVNYFYKRFIREWEEEKEKERNSKDNKEDEENNSTLGGDNKDIDKEEQEFEEEQEIEMKNGSGHGDKKEQLEEQEENYGEKEKSEDNEEKDNKEEQEEKEINKKYKELAKTLIKNVVDKVENKEMLDKINTILTNIKKHSSNNGSAINSYSGVFNPRSVIREDYKYFLQQNRTGHQKAFSKTHLGLFIDVSGSFQNNEDTTNQLLYALNRFEKQNPDFSYDLVTINTKINYIEKGKRFIKCWGGNKINDNIWEIYKKVQKPSTNNFNIVLFDGDAFSDTDYRQLDKQHKNLSVFNSSTTAIISNDENQKVIERECPNAKKIFTNKDYTQELERNILTVLQNIIR